MFTTVISNVTWRSLQRLVDASSAQSVLQAAALIFAPLTRNAMDDARWSLPQVRALLVALTLLFLTPRMPGRGANSRVHPIPRLSK